MPPAPITVKLRCASWRQLASIYRRDLSRSAFFLKTTKPPPVGTRLRINLTLPSETLIILTGTVAEHVPMGGMGGRGPGIDIKLNPIPQSAMWLIESAISTESAQHLEAPHAPAPRQPRPQAAPGPRREVPASEPEPAPAVEDGIDLVEAEDELVEALQQELDSLKRLNAFQVLGVGYGADDQAVRSAFGELTKRYHPDRFARYESAEARELASEIFIVIRDAYRRLVDAPSRARMLRLLRAGKAPAKSIGHAPTDRAGAAGAAAPERPDPAGPRPAAAKPAAARPSGSEPTRRIAPPAQTAPPEEAAQAAPPKEPAPDAPLARGSAPSAPEAEERAAPQAAPPAAKSAGRFEEAERLLEGGDYDAAIRLYTIAAKKNPQDRAARVGVELAEGLKALAQRDRLEAAQRFEEILELDPSNERAARELAEMRRQATNERKGLLSRLLGKEE